MKRTAKDFTAKELETEYRELQVRLNQNIERQFKALEDNVPWNSDRMMIEEERITIAMERIDEELTSRQNAI